MAETLERPWTLDKFFAWQELQDDRYELVNGHPLRLMAGAKNVRDDIDSGRRDPEGYKAGAPRLVAEVLSPSTRDFDSIRKLEEYKSVDGLAYILFVEPNQPLVTFWSRTNDSGWREARMKVSK